MTSTPERVKARVIEKKDVVETGRLETPCWITRYSTASHGYGQVGWRNKEGKNIVRLTHRVSWEAHNGPIPPGLTIEHRCRIRKCINPEHLELMDNIENARGGGGFHTTEPVPTGRKCGKGLHDLLRYPSGAVAC